jgi:HK97 family phage portal protein
VLTHSAVFACVTLIASDIAKLRLRLVEYDDDGIWAETESPAFSPVLRKPNAYQTRVKFIEQWIISKLIHGNTYVLKQRDNRRIVTALYVLDPTRVTPLVAQDGSVYYEIKRDDLSRQRQESVTVPSSEVIHDAMLGLFHPLVGISPIYASGMAALQGLKIQNNSSRFFENMSRPGGMLSAPGSIKDETAARLKETWENNFGGDNMGRLAVAGDGLTYVPMTVNAHDAQLIEQLKWTGENVCTCFHVPAYMVGIGPPPPYANIEPLIQQYYSGCLQSLLVNVEDKLDEGLGLGPDYGNRYGTEFDPDDLIWLDSTTRGNAAKNGIGGPLSPNEARKRFYGAGPVKGGEVPILQQQYWPIDQLAERVVPQIPAAVPQAVDADAENEEDDDEAMAASIGAALRRKSRARWSHAA